MHPSCSHGRPEEGLRRGCLYIRSKPAEKQNWDPDLVAVQCWARANAWQYSSMRHSERQTEAVCTDG